MSEEVNNPAELMDGDTTGQVTGMSKRTIYRFSASGRMPPPIRLSARLVRWNRSEIMAWIADGCPDCRDQRKGAK